MAELSEFPQVRKQLLFHLLTLCHLLVVTWNFLLYDLNFVRKERRSDNVI